MVLNIQYIKGAVLISTIISFFPFPICLDENYFSCNKNSQWQKLHFLSERHRLNKENQLKTKNFLKTSKLLHFYRLQLQIQSIYADLSSSKDLFKKISFSANNGELGQGRDFLQAASGFARLPIVLKAELDQLPRYCAGKAFLGRYVSKEVKNQRGQ